MTPSGCGVTAGEGGGKEELRCRQELVRGWVKRGSSRGEGMGMAGEQVSSSSSAVSPSSSNGSRMKVNPTLLSFNISTDSLFTILFFCSLSFIH